MAREWKPNSHECPVNDVKCKATVHGDSRWPSFHQCNRKRVKDGWCKQHHPDAEKAREAKSEARYQASMRSGRIRDGAGSTLRAIAVSLRRNDYSSSEKVREALDRIAKWEAI